ncbi:hypothetical protein RFI_19419 [Reticulomyxa filosa]|uniref:Uncharacterized protein n=1 Tax=Reticulomyxa filosa TaxID=46433 RepID=X6MW97_RETFI|nr:hypothetical protein RFI_19419 [Reticulomyxa filosa]|eukprot:ETO17886.1 hypothetical protein RFI_19419 [Reticulomyxa filosa]
MSHGVNTKQEDGLSDKEEVVDEVLEENEAGDVEANVEINESADEQPMEEDAAEPKEEVGIEEGQQEQEQEMGAIEEEEEQEIKEEDLDASDQKIVHLYEIVSELIEEQKARTQDLYSLMKGGSVEKVMRTVEERNDSLLQSLQTEFELKKAENEDGMEDGLLIYTYVYVLIVFIVTMLLLFVYEVDAQFELYNDIVKAFNEYLEAIAEFTTVIEEQKKAKGVYVRKEKEGEFLSLIFSTLSCVHRPLSKKKKNGGLYICIVCLL